MASEKVDNQARNKCEEERDHCLQYNVRVMYLIDSMERMGCKLGDPKKFITCAPLADGQRSGGFQTDSNAEPHIYLAEDASLKAGYVFPSACSPPNPPPPPPPEPLPIAHVIETPNSIDRPTDLSCTVPCVCLPGMAGRRWHTR
mmetsp:Transcript_89852/g.256900  ORF Transcript_89852/g.256900 Transcript_89852/m.256900 type:complete len:144 (-) Transcript_89852:498-929(-)